MATGVLAPPVRADVTDDRSGRIRSFQAELLRVTSPSSESYEIRLGEGTASVLVDDLALLRQSRDGARERDVAIAWTWRAMGQAVVALLAIPAGSWLTFVGRVRRRDLDSGAVRLVGPAIPRGA